MRSRVTLLICLIVVGIAVAAPAAAPAQTGDPFTDLTQSREDPKPVSTNTDDGGLDPWQQILIFLAGGVLLGGIGWAIVRDAREVAPVEERSEQLAGTRAQREEDIRRRKQRARQANKRAKASRKKNR